MGQLGLSIQMKLKRQSYLSRYNIKLAQGLIITLCLSEGAIESSSEIGQVKGTLHLSYRVMPIVTGLSRLITTWPDIHCGGQ